MQPPRYCATSISRAKEFITHMFTIYEVPPGAAEFQEQMGSKSKFWYNDPLRGLTLFKEGRPGTGENWAEKLASELAQLMGLPHASYELARYGERCGVLSPSFVPSSAELIHGNQLVGGRTTAIQDAEKLRFYRQRSHTVSRVFAYLKKHEDQLRVPQTYAHIDGIDKALDVFVGYLLFDAWICNQDRHDENWGVVHDKGELYLAPSYDHGSSLARTETDARRTTMLTTKDKGASLEAFLARARSALYPNVASGIKSRAYLAFELVELMWKSYPNACLVWTRQLENISTKDIHELIEKIPNGYMTSVAEEFTAQLLISNQNRLIKFAKK
ncbi:HipA domain-containing protein [Massilia rubra]|uniref:HipA-like protein n=1 Tax=Massilia rubra TaxID=2607910 RepID=A0ABX0LJM5_9BURK|nr:HipA domain-containing protein [Massilia rubra]NHZ35051.1 HipA-like protein [Massilia rubra]